MSYLAIVICQDGVFSVPPKVELNGVQVKGKGKASA